MTNKIIFSKSFEKAYKSRLTSSKKHVTQFSNRLELFVNGTRGYPLDDHPLYGKLAGKRAFSITADIRVIYEVVDDVNIFLDIGTHNQVYK